MAAVAVIGLGLITRGGGEGVQVLDDEELIRAVAGSPVPVAVALGHATDDLVLGRVADASFPTPTAFGAWLRSLLEERQARAQEAAQAAVLTQSRDLLEQVKQLQRIQGSLGWWRAAALVLAVLWLLTLLWLVLGRSM